MEAVGILLALPFIVLNLLGGIVGGAGLLLYGEWRLVIGGILWCVLAPFAISIAMLPGMIFAPLAMKAIDRNNATLATIAALPNLIWTYVLVSIVCLATFKYIMSREEAGIFHLLWAYSMSTAPWSFLASKDRQSGNDVASTLMMFVQLGVGAMMIAWVLDAYDMTYTRLAWWFVPFLILGASAQLFLAWSASRAPRFRY